MIPSSTKVNEEVVDILISSEVDRRERSYKNISCIMDSDFFNNTRVLRKQI